MIQSDVIQIGQNIWIVPSNKRPVKCVVHNIIRTFIDLKSISFTVIIDNQEHNFQATDSNVFLTKFEADEFYKNLLDSRINELVQEKNDYSNNQLNIGTKLANIVTKLKETGNKTNLSQAESEEILQFIQDMINFHTGIKQVALSLHDYIILQENIKLWKKRELKVQLP